MQCEVELRYDAAGWIHHDHLEKVLGVDLEGAAAALSGFGKLSDIPRSRF